MTQAPGGALYLEHQAVIEQVISAVTRRHRCRREDAEEFASSARVKLLENDAAALRRFGGRSSLRTYLTVVVERHFLDLRTQRWGKWRPSTIARRLGEDAVRVEILVTRDRCAVDEAWQTLAGRGQADLSRDEFDSIVARLPSRFRRPARDEAVDLDALPGGDESADTGVRAREAAAAAQRISAALEDALSGLPAEDRLILQLRYRDGLTVRTIAEVLGTEAKPLFRRCERLLSSVRRVLMQWGVSASEVEGLIGRDGAPQRTVAIKSWEKSSNAAV
jgi:RNA polymerase sigma factor for flagellar operon FliA